jgi:adenylate cyclase
VLDKVSVLNRSLQAKGIAQVRVRMGIESGQALVGDLGTSFRSTYTAVGDCINFASRLEVAAKDFDTPLLIGPLANSRLRNHHSVKVGEIVLRGTASSICAFTPASLMQDGSTNSLPTTG